MIPRTLHFVWLGPKPIPAEWLRAWRAMHLAWEHRVWNEMDIRALPLRNRQVFNAYLAKGDYPGAADVARVEILLHCGGVYSDIDSEPLRPLDDAPFLNAGFFAAYTLPLKGHKGRVGNGTMGGVKGHPVLQDYAAAIGHAPTLTPAWNTIGGTLLTKILRDYRNDPTVLILPTGTFYAEGRNGAKANDGVIPYIRHFWAGSPSSVQSYPAPKFPQIKSAIDPRESRVLGTLAEGKRVLEVGSQFGYSAVHMARRGAEIVHAVDWHQGDAIVGHTDSLPIMWANLRDYAVLDRVVIHVGRSEEVLPLFRPQSFGFAFHDSYHSVDAVRADIERIVPLLEPGALLAVHDYGRYGVAEAVDGFGFEQISLTNTLVVVKP